MKGTRNKNLYNRLPRHNKAGQVGPDGKVIQPEGPGFSEYATAGLGMLSTGLNAVKSNYTYTPKTTQATVGGVGYQEEQVDNSKIQNNTLSNMTAMAGAGAPLGPWGVVGGTILGAGLSIFGNNAAERAQKKANEGILNRNNFNRAGAHTTGLQNEWNLNNTNQEMQYVAQGGVITNPNARVDEGEVMQEPDGSMETVENSNPNVQQVQANTTDGYVANLKEGTRILSNKIKMPGSKQTFAEAGQKIESKLNAMKKREPKSHIEANTARLNESNLQKQYNDLFTAQEAVKGLKMRPEGSYAKGGTVSDGYQSVQYGNLPGYNTGGLNGSQGMWDDEMLLPQQRRSIYDYNRTSGNTPMENSNVGPESVPNPSEYMTSLRNQAFPERYMQELGQRLNPNQKQDLKYTEIGTIGKSLIDPISPTVNRNIAEFEDIRNNKRAAFIPRSDNPDLGQPVQYTKPNQDVRTDPKFLAQTNPGKTGLKINQDAPVEQDGNTSSTNYNDWANLAPSLMNIGNSFDSTYKAQTITPESMVSDNPYEGQILESLKRRRARFQPGFDQNNTNATIARYNSRQMGSGSRQQDVAIAAGKMRADQNVIDSTNDINNKYMTEYTNTLNQLGQQKATQMATAKQYANTYNAGQLQQQYQSEGAQRGMLQAGLKGISDYNQMKGIAATKNDYDNRMLSIMDKQASRYSIDEENSANQWIKVDGKYTPASIKAMSPLQRKQRGLV
jgi:hypothetical protein